MRTSYKQKIYSPAKKKYPPKWINVMGVTSRRVLGYGYSLVKEPVPKSIYEKKRTRVAGIFWTRNHQFLALE